MKEKELDYLTVTQNKYFNVDFRTIDIEEGYNLREDYGDIEELKASILSEGVTTPLMVNKVGERWLLRRGHRRLRAVTELYKEGKIDVMAIPVIRVPAGWNDVDLIIDQITSNTGKQFTLLEQAEVIRMLLRYKLSEKDISTRLGMSAHDIRSRIALLECPELVKQMIRDQKISATLVNQIFRENEFGTAISIISKMNEALEDSPEKSKVTKKDADKAAGKFNSVQLAKKIFKEAEKNNRLIREETLDWYEFVDNLVNGKISQQQIEQKFYI